MLTQKPSVKLDLWAVVDSGNRTAYEMLQPGQLLLERPMGISALRTGMFIFTSPIIHVDLDRRVAETKNTLYLLGEASADYKAWSREHQKAA